jgi:hypothetical protein
LTSRGLFTKNSSWAGQIINSAYYREALHRLRENVRNLRPELWRQKNWLLHHDKAPSHRLTLLLSPGNFD